LRQLRSSLFLSLILIAGASACREPSAGRASASIMAVDDLGDTVRLAAPAHRIVSLIPATTELLFALGLGSSVVGRTTWCDYPAEAARVPNLGDGLQPNLEAVLGARPDLVVLYKSTQNEAAASRLRAQGVATAVVSTDRLEDVPRLARLLALLGGRPSAGDSLAASYAQALDGATVAAPAHPASLLLLAWEQPPIAIGAGSFLSELVARAGATNLFADLPQASAPVSLESIASRNPEFVLVIGEGTPAYASRPEWQSVAAVRNRRFVRVPSGLFDRPGPRSPAALRALRAALVAAGAP
jgi:ABC-type Fe3+-hydroxamate transport system substrate-binding protein